MGSVADGIIDGLFCETCATLIDGEESGYPRTCEECKNEEENKNDK